MSTLVAVLDADVLVPILSCELLPSAFDEDLYRPVITATILDETERNLVDGLHPPRPDSPARPCRAGCSRPLTSHPRRGRRHRRSSGDREPPRPSRRRHRARARRRSGRQQRPATSSRSGSWSTARRDRRRNRRTRRQAHATPGHPQRTHRSARRKLPRLRCRTAPSRALTQTGGN